MIDAHISSVVTDAPESRGGESRTVGSISDRISVSNGPRYTAPIVPIRKRSFLQRLLDFLRRYWLILLVGALALWWLGPLGGLAKVKMFLTALGPGHWAGALLGAFIVTAPSKFGKMVGSVGAGLIGGAVSGLGGGAAGLVVLGAVAVAWWFFSRRREGDAADDATSVREV